MAEGLKERRPNSAGEAVETNAKQEDVGTDLGEKTFRLKNINDVELCGERRGSSEGGSKVCFQEQSSNTYS